MYLQRCKMMYVQLFFVTFFCKSKQLKKTYMSISGVRYSIQYNGILSSHTKD